jgi:serine/threonine protein phosphatase 1
MIIIGDVHGCYKTLMALIKQFPLDQQICFVGDLIDRGNMSKEVLDFVLDNGYDCVMGNHEEMMLMDRNMWFCNGGLKTLESIGQYGNERTVQYYQQRIKSNFPYYKIYDKIKNKDGRKLFVCHAGLSEENIQKCVDLGLITWLRDDIYNHPDYFQVIGHSPKRKPLITDYYANIDTGCCFVASNYGVLTALQFPEMIIYQQPCIDLF